MNETKSLCEVIADKLEYAIFNDKTINKGKLPSEMQLANAYGVSRPVIREALKILKARGLIDSRQGAPTTVAEYKVEDLQKNLARISKMKNISSTEVYAVRLALEVASARYAAQNATEEDLLALRKINEEMQKNSNDYPLLARLDTQFHVAVAQASKNTLLAFITEAFAGLLYSVIERTVDERTAIDGVAFHDKIISAIEKGEAENASEIMRAHLILSLRNFEEI
ncbi:MAG: FadR family transcriptional regulator [Clostridia bacterium]|nr:FadR family transcriptional regulator [Clostridia bacterium]